mmetsp:Transcript_17729/g.47144  ORF Transcript_17729/g.47144 Transcript_17729/m.47144 type:complete len:226 (+) Transcript_17729:945-1622(+)
MHFVFRSEDGEKILGCGSGGSVPLHSKIVDNDCECDRLGRVMIQARRFGGVVPMAEKESVKLLLCEAASLGESVDALRDAYHGVVVPVEADFVVVFLQDAVWDLASEAKSQTASVDAHVFRPFERGPQVKVFQVEGWPVRVLGDDGVEQDLDGLYRGSPGGGRARVVVDVSAVAPSYSWSRRAVLGAHTTLRVIVRRGADSWFVCGLDPVHGHGGFEKPGDGSCL